MCDKLGTLAMNFYSTKKEVTEHFQSFLEHAVRDQVKRVASRQIDTVAALDEAAFEAYKHNIRDELARETILSDEEWVRMIGIKIAAGIPESRKRAVSTLLRTLTLQSGYFCQFNLAPVLCSWLEDEDAKMKKFHMRYFSSGCAMRCPAEWKQVCDSFAD